MKIYILKLLFIKPRKVICVICFSILLLLKTGFSEKIYSQVLDSCLFDSTNNRINLGLYGGTCNDLSFTKSNRLFAATETSLGIFYSNDSAASWINAYPFDSLVFECGQRGWHGYAKKVITNKSGWVMACNNNTVTISYSNGDSGTWKTLVDTWILKQIGYSDYTVSNIALTDYYAYVLKGPLVIRADINGIDTIFDLSKSIPGVDSTDKAVSIAGINEAINPRFYVVVDTFQTQTSFESSGLLYMYDNVSFISKSIPSSFIYGIVSIYSNLLSSTIDTLFISGYYGSSDEVEIYSSYDGGNNWKNINYSFKEKNHLLTDVDFSANWKSQYSASGGIILICDGLYISKDLGTSWDSIYLIGSTTSAFAVHPQNLSFLTTSYPKGIRISLNGNIGPFDYAKNENLTALNIFQIARSKNKGEFYIATTAGVGYTTAYLNNSVSPIDKWQYPHGEFPLNIGDDLSISAVAINPYDSLNVIVGSSGGLYNVTTNGHSSFLGFKNFTSLPDYYVNDIAFFDSTTVIAVTGDLTSNQGKIWRSVNKGLTWTEVSPFNFKCGLSISIRDTLLSTKAIYVSCGSLATGNGILWKSTDGGKNWINHNGPNSSTNSYAINMAIFDVAVDPRSDDTLYVGAVSANNFYAEFFKSVNGGNSYIPIKVENLYETPSSILIRKSNPDSVLLAYGSSISIYDAKNDTSSLLFTGFPGEEIPDLAQGSILVGTTTGFYTIFEPDDDDIVTKIKTNNNSLSAFIYPNPANELLYIDLQNKNKQDYYILIHDMLGTCLYRNKHSTEAKLEKVNLEQFNSGMYIVSIETSKEKSNYLISIIK